ncbi:MAG TPA: SusC/RagA family TonB-linked outer membrane protein [Longimicrobium sp.]|nr:SusC/RagA family TonB-linked outer membrane protein [Longimicrobium sp.]
MSLGRKLCLALLGALLGAAPAIAQGQTGTITGRVYDAASQEGLSGATVTAAERRAVTGPDGRFTLSGVPAGAHTLRASRIGYADASRAVSVVGGETLVADVSMSATAVALEGVVAIGYGERRVRDVTGSVEAVTTEEFNTGRVVSPEQLIQGKVAGVQVVDNPEPGGGMNIRLRGGTSVTSSNEPLFVVDGVPLPVGGGLSAGRNPLNYLNPNDIARITVLKDAASTAIYGSRGANGVVIIETKSGAGSGEPAFSYTTSLSRSQVTAGVDLLSADQFRAAVQQHAPSRMGILGNASTDWRAAVEQDGVGQEHHLALAGAGPGNSYRISLGYLDQEGVIRGSATERISGAFSFTQRLFDNRLSVRANARGARTRDDFTPGGVIGAATSFAPTQPIRDAGGAWYEYPDSIPLTPNNPVAELALALEEGTTYRSTGNVEARYQMPFLEALAGTVRVGYDVASSERINFYPTILRAQLESRAPCDRDPTDPPCPTGTVNRSNPTERTGVVDAFLTFADRVDALNGELEATAGYSYESFRADAPFFEVRGLESDLLGPNGIPGAVFRRERINVRENKLASFFGRVNYTLADKYLFTASVRRDGSSKFGPEEQWGTFPAAAFGWRIIDEPFMESVGVLSDLKLRASWGVNGNQSFADYLWISAYRYGDGLARVQFGDEFVTTIRPSAVDPGIKWEETTSYNLGFDYGLFDDRITGSVEYYLKDTDDLIFRVPVAAGTNLSNYVTTNIGSMENQGVELSLSGLVVDRGGFTWDAGFNAAYNRNRLVTINAVGSGNEQILTGGISGGVGSNIQVFQPGYAVNSFLVYRHRRDADGNPIYADTNGDGQIDDQDLYVDVNNDSTINGRDRTPFESPSPDWILGHTSRLGFRGADLSFTLRAYLGNHTYNNVASNLGNFAALSTAGGPVNLHSSVLETGFVRPQYFSDVYVEDASFLRMDNLTLGYTFEGLRQLSRLRVFGTVQNVFTLTGYSGVDPTAGLLGIDNNIYPRSRTFSLGVDLGF